MKPLAWGTSRVSIPVSGYVRKPPDRDTDIQRQKDALFTIGRLIRETRIEAYVYNEIRLEVKYAGPSFCDALYGCVIKCCEPALERSKFRGTIDLVDWFSKGGKKDRRAGKKLGEANQISFLSWLTELSATDVELLVRHAPEIRLTEFEVGSLKDMAKFQYLCRRSQSPENYPDMFHLWTADRNMCDVFLTLERRSRNFAAQISKEKNNSFCLTTEVLNPLELLEKMDVKDTDPVPMQEGRFYSLFDEF